MLQIILHIEDETTLGELREFIKATKDVPDDQIIAHHDMHSELDGVSVVVFPNGR